LEESLASRGSGVRFEWEAAITRWGKEGRPAQPQDQTSLVPICGSRAFSLLVLDVSLPPNTRQQRENPGYLAIDLVADDELQLPGGRPMFGFIIRQPPIVGEGLQEDLTVDGLHIAPEVTS